MKRATALLLFMLPALTIYSQGIELYKYGGALKGNLKQVRTYYRAFMGLGGSNVSICDYCNGLPIVSTTFFNSDLGFIARDFYDEEGKILERDRYTFLGGKYHPPAFNQSVYSYEDGLVIRQEDLSEGKVYSTTKYHYDTIGRRTEMRRTSRGYKTADIVTYEYEGTSKYPCAELFWMDEQKGHFRKAIRKYYGKRIVVVDVSGRIVEERFENSKEEHFRESSTWVWDDCADTLGKIETMRITRKYVDDQLTEESKFDSTNALISKSIYEYEDYDEQGNWRIQKEYYTLKASTCATRIMTTRREIEYEEQK